ncbi:hypothetical protein HK405_015912, partial [Cladochytrium tenue]
VVTYLTFLLALLGSAALLGALSYLQANSNPLVESVPKNGTTVYEAATRPYDSDPLNKLNYNMIVIETKPVAVNPASFTYQMEFSFTPCDVKTIKFQKGDIMVNQDVTFIFGNGLLNDYPFDKYEGNPIIINAVYKDNGTSTYVPLDVIALGKFHRFVPVVIPLRDLPAQIRARFRVLTNRSWKVDIFQLEDASGLGKGVYTGTTVLMNLRMWRSATAIFFCIVQMFNMWALASISLTLSAFIWIRNRKVEPPVLTFLCSLLFAIPKIRNSQPGVPTVGCWSDVISFFWAMILTATA